jgi:hypothetical protein
MRYLKTFESYGSAESSNKEEMISHLCQCGWERHELEGMEEEELEKMMWETEPREVTESKEEESEKDEEESDEEESDEEESDEEEIKEAKWIKDAIKKPGALRRSMNKKKGEKITKTEIDSELAALRGKDKDKEKPGVQLGKADAKKYKRLNLAKTLRNMK